jgi:ATP-dependent Lhr-like helicase
MGDKELLAQAGDGTLLAGPVGDRIVNHYTFYSAFKTAEEYRLMTRGRTLGTIPVDYPILPGSLLIFAGLRWQVTDVDSSARIIELARSGGGRPPAFSGGGAEVSDHVRKRMRKLYESDVMPPYLDATAQSLLDEGRNNFARLRLADRRLVPWGDDTIILPWRGDVVLNTLAVALNGIGLKVAQDGAGLTVAGADPAAVVAAATHLVRDGEPEAASLAASVTNKARDKYDEYLSDQLQSLAYASRNLDVAGAWEVLRDLAVERVEPPDHAPDTTSRAEAASIRPRLGETPFAVLDIETTGFLPLRNDRIVEIAIVHLDAAGVVTSQWSTLINPLRSAGPSHIHGLTESDLADAPTWGQVAEWVADQLSGRIVVAHNAPFDLSFINIEFDRVDLTVPPWPILDTLEIATLVSDSADRTLHGCCAAAGVALNNAHTAWGDADATAQLLACYLRTANRRGLQLHHLVSDAPLSPTAPLRPSKPPTLPRTVIRPIEPETAMLISALAAAHPRTDDPAINAYLAVLDRLVLSGDRGVDVADLLIEANRLGLGEAQARTVTRHYMTVARHGTNGRVAATISALGEQLGSPPLVQ